MQFEFNIVIHSGIEGKPCESSLRIGFAAVCHCRLTDFAFLEPPDCFSKGFLQSGVVGEACDLAGGWQFGAKFLVKLGVQFLVTFLGLFCRDIQSSKLKPAKAAARHSHGGFVKQNWQKFRENFMTGFCRGDPLQDCFGRCCRRF